MNTFSIFLISTFIVFSTSVNAYFIPACYVENTRPFWQIFTRINPPKNGTPIKLISEFCKQDAPKISQTMPVGPQSIRELKCYSSVSGQLVIEVPNIYFNDCQEPESLIGSYASNWAKFSLTPIEIVVFNRAHKFIQIEYFPTHHRVFEYVRYLSAIEAKISSYQYEIENSETTHEDLTQCQTTINDDNPICSKETLRLLEIIDDIKTSIK